MHSLKKFTKAMALALALTMAVPAGMPMSNAVVAEAAAVKLSATKKSLKVGKSFTLTVKGTKKKVTWSSSKKSVATVSKKGKVTAKKAGTATITAKVGGKSYKCKVTVTNPVNKYVAKAPFEAKEVKLGTYTAAVPKNWKLSETEQNGIHVYMLVPEDADMNTGTSNIAVTVIENAGSTQENFDLLKAYVSEAITKEYMENAFGGMAVISNFSVDEKAINLGKAVTISYSAELEIAGEKSSLKQTIYDVFANGYTVEITVTDNGTAVTPDVNAAAEYLVNSLIYVK